VAVVEQEGDWILEVRRTRKEKWKYRVDIVANATDENKNDSI